MSIVTVQLGQCGNQIGSQLFSTIFEDACSSERRGPTAYSNTSLARFFSERERGAHDHHSQLKARAVLVDMESKVVHQSLIKAKQSSLWEYDAKCVYTQHRGSGNNWANGFFKHGPAARVEVLEMVRRQTEECDHLDGFLILMSVAGGTGSGVGAYVTELLRDTYPHTTLANQIIWPYASGEVIVQDYNTILTTAHLQKSTDAVILSQNDQLHKICSNLLHLEKISFTDINRVACHSLASVLQPAVKLEHFYEAKSVDPLLYSMCSLNELKHTLCPHSDYKLLTLKSIPQMPESSHAYSRYLWSGLLKHLRQMLITDSPIEEGMDWSKTLGSCDPGHTSERVHHGVNKSLSNLLILRGNELSSVESGPFSDPRLYSTHIPASGTCSVWCSSHTFNRYEKSATLMSNSQGCVTPLDAVCSKAWRMFSAKAYVHQYSQYGLEYEDMLGCFVTVEQMIRNYTTM